MSLLIPAITTGIGFLGQLFGQAKSAEANNRAFDNIRKRRGEITSAYNQDYNKDFLDNTENKSAIRNYQDNMSKIRSGLKNTAVKTGATAESVVATGAKMNDSYGGFLNKLTSGATRYKQAIKDRYTNRMDSLDNQEQNILGQKGKDWTNFGNNVANAGAGLLKSWALGGKTVADSNDNNPFEDNYDIYKMGNNNVSK